MLALEAEGIDLDTRVAVEGGDQVGRQPLRDLRVLGQEVFVVGVEAVGAVACGAAHRLDAGADDEILMTGSHAHRCEGDRLLAGTTEAVQGDAGNRDRPTGIEHGHPSDVVGMVAGVRAVATHDVVDVGRVEPDAVTQAVQHLSEDVLRVQVRQAALALLADATR